MPKTNETWMIENAIARYQAPGSLSDMHVQLFRTRIGTTLQSWSRDEGRTWSFPKNSTLPNPNSRVSHPDHISSWANGMEQYSCGPADEPLAVTPIIQMMLGHAEV